MGFWNHYQFPTVLCVSRKVLVLELIEVSRIHEFPEVARKFYKILDEFLE